MPVTDKTLRIGTMVRAHEPTLIQVLFNLVHNALKFVAPEVVPVIRLRVTEHDGFARVWVEDNGIGIAPEHQQQIFGIFMRLYGDKYPGTGIGLAIVQRGVERAPQLPIGEHDLLHARVVRVRSRDDLVVRRF